MNKQKDIKRNHVAKFAHRFNKSVVIPSRKDKQKSRHPKHKKGSSHEHD